MEPKKQADAETNERVRKGGATQADFGYDLGEDEEAGSSATRGNDRPGKKDESGAVLDDPPNP
jgi:hypothetical protein